MDLCWVKAVDTALGNTGMVHGMAKAHTGVETDGHLVSDDAALGSSSSVQSHSLGQNVQLCEVYPWEHPGSVETEVFLATPRANTPPCCPD